MRWSILALPMMVAGAMAPAGAQVRATVRVGIPATAVARRAPLVIGAYSPEVYGPWLDSYQDWEPLTAYYYDGAYYDYPIVDWARPVQVYRYQHRVFFPPRDPEYIRLRTGALHRRYPVRGTYHWEYRPSDRARALPPRAHMTERRPDRARPSVRRGRYGGR